jgi:hypothetical protein
VPISTNKKKKRTDGNGNESIRPQNAACGLECTELKQQGMMDGLDWIAKPAFFHLSWRRRLEEDHQQ